MVLFVMGVSGSGKSTIGQLLSEKLGITFFDGDQFHSEENVKKMASGTPLTDADRADWLDSINQKALEMEAKGLSVIFACSALKRTYREVLCKNLQGFQKFIFLEGNKDVILKRHAARKNHFMPTALLDSQFNILEYPENALRINIDKKPIDMVNSIMKEITSEFGLIGLGVMGKSLARNLANKGFKLSLYNRRVEGIEELVAHNFVMEFPELKDCLAYEDLQAFVLSIKRPRKVFLMVHAGKVTDEVIDQLKEIMEPGDVILDGGNSFYADTQRRADSLGEILFLGCGVSGGEEGALKGPSIMPGGSKKAYLLTEKYLRAIAAKDKNGQACCSFIGAGGSGHFVKMVHNGIEYAEMQLIAECFALLRFGLHRSHAEISNIFKEWNAGELSSYLLEISSDILLAKQGEEYVVDLIYPSAGNKGTGSWTTINAAETGEATTLIASALWARFASVSLAKDKELANTFGDLRSTETILTVDQIKNAYSLARKINHIQGLQLIKTNSELKEWHIDLSELCRIWTNGCIIRSKLMEDLSDFLQNEKGYLEKIPAIEMHTAVQSLRSTCSFGILHAIAIPCLNSAVDYMNAYLGAYSTANMIQAQRDYFGAHTFKWASNPSGPAVHFEWTKNLNEK